MLSSGIIDLAVGLILVSAVPAAISWVGTELIARLLGLRGAYLMLGLRELLDSQGTPVDLGAAEQDFTKVRDLINKAKVPPAGGVATRVPALPPGPHSPGPGDPTSTT